jgi:hypothetical protein
MEGVADAGAIVAEIDRRSLRLEKSISGQQNSSSSPAGPLPKSPRGERAAPVAFDADLDAKKPRQKVTHCRRRSTCLILTLLLLFVVSFVCFVWIVWIVCFVCCRGFNDCIRLLKCREAGSGSS